MSVLAQTQNLLNELAASEDGPTSCFALTQRGEVVWFDRTGSPYRVTVEGAALVSGELLKLPNQTTVQGISSAEAYRRLTSQVFQPRQVYRPTSSAKTLRMPLLIVGMAGFGVFILTNLLASATTITAQVAVVAAQPGYYNPIAPPSISLATFKTFLAELNSPALSEAASMYSASVEEGADPLLALAFFEHESSGGNAGVASITKSIGNIRCTPGYNCYDSSSNGSFRQYSTWTEGLRDWVRLLKYYRDGRGLTTLEQIIPTYAPAGDNNNEAAYVASVKHRVNNLRERVK